MGFVCVVFCGAMLGFVVPALLSLISPRWVPFFRIVSGFTNDHAAAIGALALTMLITQLVTAFFSSKNR